MLNGRRNGLRACYRRQNQVFNMSVKKVLIISGSPRKQGNSDLLCDEFARGAREAGHQVEKVRVAELKIGYCRACYYCAKHDGVCAIKDDMAVLLAKIQAADVVVWASPVYFYSIDAQLKAVIDRCVAQWTTIADKDFYYLMTSAEDSATVMDTTLACFRGLADCLNDIREKGIVYGKGVTEPGEVRETPYPQQAYALGKAV